MLMYKFEIYHYGENEFQNRRDRGGQILWLCRDGEGKDLQEYIQAGPEMLYLCEMILEAVRKGM